MEGLKKHYDRVVLVAAALIAIGVSALIATRSFGFGDRFKQTVPSPGEDFGPTDPALVTGAATSLDSAAEWKVPTMSGQPDKELKLFRSVTIVEKDNVVYDLLDPKSPPLREGMTNKFLVDNNLDFKRDDVGLDFIQCPQRYGFGEVAGKGNFVAEFGLAVVNPCIGDMWKNLSFKVFFNVFLLFIISIKIMDYLQFIRIV